MLNALTVRKIITYMCLHTLFDNYPIYSDRFLLLIANFVSIDGHNNNQYFEFVPI